MSVARVAGIACLCALLVTTGCRVSLPAGVVYPSITPTHGEPRLVTHEFTFEKRPVRVTVTVDGGLYEGARRADKAVVHFGDTDAVDWLERYYPAFVDEPHQERFYADVLSAFRAIRDAASLDQDRYAELLCVFVQSLEYHTDPVDLSPKFPVETFVDGYGDCDDKTLLLAGLLSREGYDVAVMLFEPERHVALGIRCPELDYRQTGYAFVETTTQGFIGMPPDRLAAGGTLESEPLLFRIGAGTRAYTAGAQVREILAARERAVAEAETLTARIDAADAALTALGDQATQMRERLESLRDSGDVDAYNALVPAYNALVERYNAALSERNALVERYNGLAELERVIAEGLTDRLGTYRAVASFRE